MKTYLYKQLGVNELKNLTKRPAQDINNVYETIKPIMADVKANGDQSLFKYTEKFDGIKLEKLLIGEDEIKQAANYLDASIKEAFKVAASNIEKFHRSQVISGPRVQTMPGVVCFREMRAIEKIGLYIPGGTAPLASAVLMLGIPAMIAGCKEVVLCTPPPVTPEILYAASLCGIKKIYQVGGAQAVAAMAYGTETIPQVYKIFGAGNKYVTAAKMLASLESVAIDMPAGPSEVLIIADDMANCSFVAADLLSQAEHGADSQVILVCLSQKLANGVAREIEQQIEVLPRKLIAKQSLSKSFTVVCETLSEAFDFSNNYAPEHLIINLQDAEKHIGSVVNAGSVFIGQYSCEAAGDYASGTNHTLPTYGCAKAYSGLSVDNFVKNITFQKLSEQGIKSLGATVEIMADCEQLQAHKNAMSIRIKNLKQ